MNYSSRIARYCTNILLAVSHYFRYAASTRFTPLFLASDLLIVFIQDESLLYVTLLAQSAPLVATSVQLAEEVKRKIYKRTGEELRQYIVDVDPYVRSRCLINFLHILTELAALIGRRHYSKTQRQRTSIPRRPRSKSTYLAFHSKN